MRRRYPNAVIYGGQQANATDVTSWTSSNLALPTMETASISIKAIIACPTFASSFPPLPVMIVIWQLKDSVIRVPGEKINKCRPTALEPHESHQCWEMRWEGSQCVLRVNLGMWSQPDSGIDFCRTAARSTAALHIYSRPLTAAANVGGGDHLSVIDSHRECFGCCAACDRAKQIVRNHKRIAGFATMMRTIY